MMDPDLRESIERSAANLKYFIDIYEEKLGDLRKNLQAIQEKCPHVMVPSAVDKDGNPEGWAVPICTVCGKRWDDWWCPDSPDHRCDYNQEDGHENMDSCRYCGQPDERK